MNTSDDDANAISRSMNTAKKGRFFWMNKAPVKVAQNGGNKEHDAGCEPQDNIIVACLWVNSQPVPGRCLPTVPPCPFPHGNHRDGSQQQEAPVSDNCERGSKASDHSHSNEGEDADANARGEGNSELCTECREAGFGSWGVLQIAPHERCVLRKVLAETCACPRQVDSKGHNREAHVHNPPREMSAVGAGEYKPLLGIEAVEPGFSTVVTTADECAVLDGRGLILPAIHSRHSEIDAAFRTT